MAKFYVIDTETPNIKNNKICSLAITLVDNGKIADTKHWLINPECEFDNHHTDIHGLCADDVKDAPTFPTVWNEIYDIVSKNVIVAHSAAGADLLFIKNTLLSYGIIIDKPIRFFCTLQWSRRLFPELQHHRLNDMCNYFNIPLNHHDASSDSKACAELLLKIMENGINPARRYRYYLLNDSNNDQKQDHIEDNVEIDIPFDETKYYNLNSINDKTICVTGDFSCGTKDYVLSTLKEHGARIVGKLSGKVEIVLVGSKGSSSWSHSNYGSKIEDALKFIEKGSSISIIKETDFF